MEPTNKMFTRMTNRERLGVLTILSVNAIFHHLRTSDRRDRLLDNSAGQWRPIFQGNGYAVGFGFVALVTQSVCKFMPNRKIEQVFDWHMPYRTKLHAANRCSDH